MYHLQGSKVPGAHDKHPLAPLQDQVANVLVRLALLLLNANEGAAKDDEVSLQQQYSLGLVGQAASVWTTCTMKVGGPHVLHHPSRWD